MQKSTASADVVDGSSIPTAAVHVAGSNPSASVHTAGSALNKSTLNTIDDA